MNEPGESKKEGDKLSLRRRQRKAEAKVGGKLIFPKAEKAVISFGGNHFQRAKIIGQAHDIIIFQEEPVRTSLRQRGSWPGFSRRWAFPWIKKPYN